MQLFFFRGILIDGSVELKAPYTDFKWCVTCHDTTSIQSSIHPPLTQPILRATVDELTALLPAPYLAAVKPFIWG